MLTLLSATTNKDDEMLAVFAEIHSIPETKIYAVLENSGADTLDAGEISETESRYSGGGNQYSNV